MTAPLARPSLPLLTTEEAAAILRVRKSWLERQAACRKIPFTMLGGCYRFTEEHLVGIVRIFERTPTTEDNTIAPDQLSAVRSKRRSSRDDFPKSSVLRARPRIRGAIQ